MLINPTQLKKFGAIATENFIERVADHLRTHYATSSIRLPNLTSTVDELPLGTLHALVRKSIGYANSKGLQFESSIAVFSAMMFDVSPNFYQHPLAKIILGDERMDINKRLDKLLDTLTDDDWALIKEGYDINAWQYN